MAAVLPRTFDQGETVVLGFGVPVDLTAGIVTVSARRAYDSVVETVACFELTTEGTGKFSIDRFAAAVNDPSGTDVWNHAHVHVISGAFVADFHLWPPDGQFRVTKAP